MIIVAYNEVIFGMTSLPCELISVAVLFIVATVASNFVAFFIRFLPLKTLKIIIYEHRPQIKPNQAET